MRVTLLILIFSCCLAQAQDGTLKWSFLTEDDVDSSPTIGSDGTLYVGSRNSGRLYAIHPDGTQKWVFQTGGGVNSSPAIGIDGTLYIGLTDNRFYAIRGSSGGLANSSWPMFRRDLKHTAIGGTEQ